MASGREPGRKSSRASGREGRGAPSARRSVGLVAAAALVGLIALAVLAIASPGTDPAAADGRWDPRPTTEPWQFQLQGKVDRSIPAPVFETDGDYTSRSTVRALRRKGVKVICYLNAGSWEAFRKDRGRFPKSVIGRRYDGYPNERWLDVRRFRLFAPAIRARVRTCRSKGFHGIEFDNVNGWENRTGFGITARQQLRYNRWLARLAHRNGLAAGLKNDGRQVRRLVRSFDFAVVEQCFQYGECGQYRPFVARGKAVFSVEYERPLSEFCERAIEYRFSAIGKQFDLFARPWRPCRNDQAG